MVLPYEDVHYHGLSFEIHIKHMGQFAKATALSLRDQVMDEFWELQKCIWNSKWGFASYVAVSEDSGFKRLLKCLDCKHTLWDTEVISKNFGPNNHFKSIFSLWMRVGYGYGIERQNKALRGWGQSKTENNTYLAFTTFTSLITQGFMGKKKNLIVQINRK